MLWLQHIDVYGGTWAAKWMFRIIAVASAGGISAILARRRHHKWPAKEKEGVRGPPGSILGGGLSDPHGFELMQAVMAAEPTKAGSKSKRKRKLASVRQRIR
mmetsp:Transcript_3958/g.11506  ORF Transcript_3958/g.11506 Transcript_3958/m.11506 type:complete len:102 (+) Transcript_3958:536-841(+)